MFVVQKLNPEGEAAQRYIEPDKGAELARSSNASALQYARHTVSARRA